MAMENQSTYNYRFTGANDRCVVLTSIRGDLRFLSKWFAALTELQLLLLEARKEPSFDDHLVIYNNEVHPDFGLFFVRLISKLRCSLDTGHFAPVTLKLNQLGIELAILASIGFLSKSGKGYELSLPKAVLLDDLKECAAQLAKTIDDDLTLHPELFLRTLTVAQSEQFCLDEMIKTGALQA